MISPQEDELLPTDEVGLEKRMAELLDEKKACEDHIQALMGKEDPLKGVFFAKEIHDAKQENMIIRYKYDLCKARLNRLRML